jgi:hypothetical protein
MNNSLVFRDPTDSGLLERLLRKNIQEREEGLMLAVLADAVEYFQKYVLAEDEKGKKLFQEEEEWILEKNSDWLFSFENICEALRLDPNYIRQGLLSWKEEAQRKFDSKAVNNHNRRRCYGRKIA